MTEDEIKQKFHYNALIEEYEYGYDDKYSRIYRSKFIDNVLVKNLDLHGKITLEGMCGSGQTTGFLLSRGALVIGNDISEVCTKRFQERWPQCKVVCSSITDTGLAAESIDFVIVVGALHHLHPSLNDAIDEVYRVLKKGGYFCFYEPHSGSIPDYFRKIWYKFDKYFADNEASIDIDGLQRINVNRFNFISQKYMGNFGFLFVQNSMILRIPRFIKTIISPFMLWLEALITPFQGKLLSCSIIVQWQKI